MALRLHADPANLQRRVDELEARIRSLRMSRRVLLDLLRRVEHEKQQRLQALEREVAVLRARNQAYARRLWEQNRLLAAMAAGRGQPEAGTAPVRSKEQV